MGWKGCRYSVYYFCNSSVDLRSSTHESFKECSLLPSSLSKKPQQYWAWWQLFHGSLSCRQSMEKLAQLTHKLLSKLLDTFYSLQEQRARRKKMSRRRKSERLILFSCPEGRRKAAFRNQRRENLNTVYYSHTFSISF